MQFLYPAYLFGLSLILIPIIIHLFKLRRYKTVYFSSLKFLTDAQTSHRNKSRLKDILLLISRIILIVCLVLAFAQPYWPSDNVYTGSDEVVVINIDVSQSMKNQAIDGSLFDQAKREAIAIVKKYPLSTQFIILDQDNPKSSSMIVDQAMAIDNISKLGLSNHSSPFSEQIKALEIDPGISDESKINTIHVFSDFQTSQFDFENLSDSSLNNIVLNPSSPVNQNNIFIDSCWLVQPIHHFGSRISISGTINNEGSIDYTQFPISLLSNDSIVARTTVDLIAGSFSKFSISYLPNQNGIQKLELTFNDYPVDYDNSFYMSFNLNERTRICHLFENEPNIYLKSALDLDSAFLYQEYPIGAYPENDFAGFETVLITGFSKPDGNIIEKLKTFVKAGGNLIVFPDAASNPQQLNSLARSFESPILLDKIISREDLKFSMEMSSFHTEISLNPESTLSWPSVLEYYRTSSPGFSTKTLVETSAGRPALLSTRSGSGIFTIAAFSLDVQKTSMPDHPLFIPILYYLTTAEARQTKIYTRIGSRDPFPIPLPEKLKTRIRLSGADSGFSFTPHQEVKTDIPYVNVFIGDYAGSPGFIYADISDKIIGVIAFNNSKAESIMDFFSMDELTNLADQRKWRINQNLEDLQSNFEDLRSTSNKTPVPITRLLLLIALIMIIFETLLYRKT